MEKLKNNKKILIISAVVLMLLGGLILWGGSNNGEPMGSDIKIESISPSRLEVVIKEKQDLFIIMGESSTPTTMLLIDSVLANGTKIDKPVYYLDTSYYTAEFTNTKDKSKTELQDAIDRYLLFLNRYQVESLPTIVKFEKGKVSDCLGKYIPDEYSLSKTKEETKAKLLDSANKNLESWLKK